MHLSKLDHTISLHVVAWWLSCLHCCLTARRSWVRFPHGALLALGDRSSPECTVLKWAISGAFLCGVCMFSPCSQGVSSANNPNRKKHAKEQNTLCRSLTKTDGSSHLVPGRLKKSCPLRGLNTTMPATTVQMSLTSIVSSPMSCMLVRNGCRRRLLN